MKKKSHTLNKPLWPRKSLNIMRCILFFILLGTLESFAGVTYSQALKLSLKTQNKTIQDVLTTIEEKSDFYFTYNIKQIDAQRKVSIQVKDKTVTEILDELFAEDDVHYIINDKHIALYKSNETKARLQAIRVSGIITDKNGEAIIGANILEKGNTTNGTISDMDGNFSLTVPENAILVISYIGYDKVEIPVNGRSVIQITLTEDSQTLEEVVVVGYGTQKKVNLTGSVSTVNFEKEALSRPITTAAAALSGMSAGLQVMQSSGRPNSESIGIQIRGTGTLNSSAPLVLVDGMEQSLSDVNPNDIATISILKDAASCSIYGNRGANGVILITTKTGKQGKVNVTYSGTFSYNTPSNFVRMVSNYADYMELINESAENIGQSTVYSDATINKWREAEKNPNGIAESGYPNYVAYPNTDWFDAIFKEKMMSEHTISVLGQEGRTNYNFSGTYLNNPGLVDNSGVKKYFVRTNLSSDITKWLRVGARLWGYHTDQDRNDVNNLTDYSFKKLVPGVYPYYDGKFGGIESHEEDPAAGNAILTLDGNGDSYYKYNQLYTTVYADINFLKDFSYNVTFNYDYFATEHKYTGGSNSTYSFSRDQIVQAATPSDQISTYMYNKGFFKWKFTQLLKWNHVFDQKHDVGAMAGYEEERYKENWSDSQKQGVLDPTITDLTTVTTMKYIKGGRTGYTSRSYFGRATYAYDSRYLFEVNLRYDGSSRFSPDSRWGLFPSFSAGWRVSEEAFMENSGVDNLKLRASWGKLGNNSIGNYEWQSTYGSAYYAFGDNKTSALVQSSLANSALEWETTTITDIGVDFAILNNRLTAEIDYYDKTANGILYRPDIYLTMGNKTAPLKNIAEVNNRGIEVTLGWQDKIEKVNYRISGNISYNRNQVTKYKGELNRGWKVDENGNKTYYTNLGDVSTGGGTRIVEGKIINEFYMLDPYKGDASYFNSDGSVNIAGGPKDGMIRSEKDMQWLEAMVDAGHQFYPNQQIDKSKIWYGDYIYADSNGDGIYGNTHDMNFQNTSTTPKYIYGLQASASWNNFDFSMNWAGAAGFKVYWYETGQNSSAGIYGLAIGKKVGYDHYFYDPENPSDPRTNLTSKNPRLTLNQGSDQSGSQWSSVHLHNADFIKLKNLTIGYTLPKNILSKLYAENIRFYVSGENLLTITPFEGIDPEMRAGVGYAPLRQYAFGVNVTF